MIKRLLVYNALIGLMFWLFWALLVVLEVKWRLYSDDVGIASYFLVFLCFFWVNQHLLRKFIREPKNFLFWAALASVILSPVCIVLGVIVVVNFKIAIGGQF